MPILNKIKILLSDLIFKAGDVLFVLEQKTWGRWFSIYSFYSKLIILSINLDPRQKDYKLQKNNLCDECGSFIAEVGNLCSGCYAYREHTGSF